MKLQRRKIRNMKRLQRASFKLATGLNAVYVARVLEDGHAYRPDNFGYRATAKQWMRLMQLAPGLALNPDFKIRLYYKGFEITRGGETS